MRVIKFCLKFVTGIVLLVLSLAWMVFFGVFATAMVASVLFFPLGIATYGLAAMPLFAALTWMGLRSKPQTVVVNVAR